MEQAAIKYEGRTICSVCKIVLKDGLPGLPESHDLCDYCLEHYEELTSWKGPVLPMIVE